MDQLEDKGIIGPQDGSKPRDVRINMQQWLEMKAYDTNANFTSDNTVQMAFDTNNNQSSNDDDFVDISKYIEQNKNESSDDEEV